MTENNNAPVVEQQLDAMNKILLATGTINYMASAINGVIDNYRHMVSAMEKEGSMPDSYKIFKESLCEKELQMISTLDDLCAIVEDLGNFLNNCGATCAIDLRVYKVPLEILLHGKDDVNDYYEEDND